MTLFGNRILQIQLVRMRSYWSEVGPQSNTTGVLRRKEEMQIETRTEATPCDDAGAETGAAGPQPRNARTASKTRSREREGAEQVLHTADSLRGPTNTWIWISNFQNI